MVWYQGVPDQDREPVSVQHIQLEKNIPSPFAQYPECVIIPFLSLSSMCLWNSNPLALGFPRLAPGQVQAAVGLKTFE